MPELPEVETVVRGLRKTLPGSSILEVCFGKSDFVDDPAALDASVRGSRVSEITRMGKFICIALERDQREFAGPNAGPIHLSIHLGMTGRLTVCAASQPAPTHTHCVFVLDGGRELRYTDIRRFGQIQIVSPEKMPEFAAHLGPEPLEISSDDFLREFGLRRARIKALLLDQSVLRGIGNIYADESLFRARLHPARIAASLTKKQLIALHRAIREVLTSAIQFRGSSISDYLDAEGNRGEFQLRHRVYQREGKPCVRCRTKIRRVIVAGRSSHFCPHCQHAPRKRKS